MSLITDGILIVASLTACFYCVVLNIRLKALRNTKSGIGATIGELTSSVGELETSLAKTKEANALAAEKLEDLVGEAGTLADFLSDLLERAETARDTAETVPPSPDAPKASAANKETPSPAGVSLDVDDGKAEPEEKTEEVTVADLNLDLDYEKDEPGDAEPPEETIPIDLDYDAEETRKIGTG